MVDIALLRSAPFAAAIRMNVTDDETSLMISRLGFQPIFVAVTSDLIDGLGCAKSTKTFAHELLRARICCVTSGAVTSNGCTLTIRFFFLPRPARKPERLFFPY